MLISISWLFADEAVTYSEARRMATKFNKPILIDFWRDN